jgi:hypothetical protein
MNTLAFWVGFCLATIEYALQPAIAQQCVNPIVPNCNFYTSCLEATCKCGEKGYGLNYGKKYCQKFLSSYSFSEKGKKWRDATLVCLQERLYAAVPNDSVLCDCNTISQTAYKSHVECYTQSGNSICSLDSADLGVVYELISLSDLTDTEGLKALGDVAAKCFAEKATEAWKDIKKKISEALP